jgi:hypothetical protein
MLITYSFWALGLLITGGIALAYSVWRDPVDGLPVATSGHARQGFAPTGRALTARRP